MKVLYSLFFLSHRWAAADNAACNAAYNAQVTCVTNAAGLGRADESIYHAKTFSCCDEIAAFGAACSEDDDFYALSLLQTDYCSDCGKEYFGMTDCWIEADKALVGSSDKNCCADHRDKMISACESTTTLVGTSITDTKQTYNEVCNSWYAKAPASVTVLSLSAGALAVAGIVTNIIDM